MSNEVADPTQEAIERVKSHLRVWEETPVDAMGGQEDAQYVEDIRTLIDTVERQREALSIVDLYFEPWGAAKAAQWEDMTKDKPFTAEVALREIQKRATLNKEPEHG